MPLSTVLGSGITNLPVYMYYQSLTPFKTDLRSDIANCKLTHWLFFQRYIRNDLVQILTWNFDHNNLWKPFSSG